MHEIPARRWLIDGMNVIGSRPDGWWNDRRGAMQRLAERLTEFADASGEPVTVVFDSKPFSLSSAVEVVFAPGGPNAADDAIAEIVSSDPEPSTFTVVTSDRALVRRVEASGATTEGAASFLSRLDR